MMSDADLTIILCELLGGINGWAWSPNQPAEPGTVPVHYGQIPDHPDRAVGVRVYGGTDPGLYSPTRDVQIRIRGARNAPADADLLAAQVFATLQGLSRHRGILHAQRTSFGPWGADTNGREERSDNYRILLDNQEVTP